MSDAKWTKEQLEAITESGCNLLVAAAAGAGKTAVLVERIIRKITDDKNPVDIDKLLVVTFTNAAATEMRERVSDAISKALDMNPDSDILQRQLLLLNKASITTIHSFCLEVIRNNFHCIELDPGFRIADETESILMKMEVLEELFDEKYEKDVLSEDFIKLVECYGGNRDDRMLQEIVLTLYEFVQSHPWPEKWLKEHVEAYNLPDGFDFGQTEWGRELKKSIEIELNGALNILKKARELVERSEGLEPYLTNLNDDFTLVSDLLSCCNKTENEWNWDKLFLAFTELQFGRLSRCGRDVDKVVQEQVKTMRDNVKDLLKKIKEKVFTANSRDIIDDLQKLYPVVRCLSDLVLEFGEKYKTKKKEKSLLDFSDLEHFCLEILTQDSANSAESTSADLNTIVPSEAALAYRERYEEILVDEYQDSNLVQEVILNIISRKDTDKPNVFMVGDVKQSIYRFRQARPELFLEKYNMYSSESGFKNRKILLYKNFRSREEVINSVNYIFKQIMSMNIGELDYNENEYLNLGASYNVLDECDSVCGGEVELHIIDMDHSEDMNDEEDINLTADDVETAEISDEEEQPDAMQMEARVVAKRINEFVNPVNEDKIFKVYDKKMGSYRKVEYRDIVILLRTTRNWSNVFVEELSAQGIPAYADSGSGYFKTIEVQTILSLLQIIDNPMQDIAMLSVLRSPIAEISPDELVEIRMCNKEGSFYEAMKIFAQIGTTGISEKIGNFLENLSKWRNRAFYMSTSELIWYLFSDTGYYSYAGAMPGGEQRQANLRILFERARQYEETSYKGLFNFINFINRLKSSSGDMGSAKILGENENVVRIMSIHKSKGLEFPVVIVSGCSKRFNMQDMNKSILVHQDLGFGLDYVDYKRRIQYSTIPKHAVRYRMMFETLSEELRILYVAFTRAREKLVITGTVKNLANAAAKWSECLYDSQDKLPEYRMLKARCYLDWIAPVVMRHNDGNVLRNLLANDVFSIKSFDDKSSWKVTLWNRENVLKAKNDEEIVQKDISSVIDRMTANAADSMYNDDIEKRLAWEYPYSKSGRLPTKMSVTELKRRFNTEFADEYSAASVHMPPLIKKPVFLQEKTDFSAAERGTILHFVMQHINLSKAGTINDIKFQVDQMVINELLTQKEAETVDYHRINRFLHSELGKRLIKAERLYREVPFNIEVRSTEIYRDLPEDLYGDDTILLQGVIDCYFEENGEIVLIDYKTDYVQDNEVDVMKEKYRMQIEYYTMALQQIMGRKVRERYIYLFWNGHIIKY